MPYPQVRSGFFLCPSAPVALEAGTIDLAAARTAAPFGQVYDLVDQVHEEDLSFPLLGYCVMEGLQIATR